MQICSCYGKHIFFLNFTGHIYSRKMSINTVLIDLVMVHEDCRKKGIGTELMQHVMELHKGCVFCLTSYEDVNGFYTKLGFKKTGNQLCRVLTFPVNVVSDPVPNDDVDITLADNSTMPKVISLSKHMFGHHARELLECICNDRSNTLLYATSRDQGEGFIVFKEIGNVCKIRGFCADSVDVAKHLLRKCISEVAPESVYSIGYLSCDNNFHKACGELLENGTKWKTVEDMMSTSENPTQPFVWQNLYGIFQYYLTLP